MNTRIASLLLVCSATIATSTPARATVTVYTNKASWQSDAGAYSTITFTELPSNTLITEQYAPLGVHFTDGADYVFHNANAFPTDDYGLNGAFDSTTLNFDVPINAISVDFPGGAKFQLFANGQLFYTSPTLGGAGPGFFGGLISTELFDQAIIYDPTGGFFADNLYFSTIPAPAGMALPALAGLCDRTRRRSA